MGTPVLLLASGTLLLLGLVIVLVTFASGLGARRTPVVGDAVAAVGGPSDRTAFGSRMSTLGRVAGPRSGSMSRLHRWLDYAGNPSNWPVERVFEMKGLGLIVLALVGGFIGLAFGSVVEAVVGALAGAVLGFFAADLVVYQIGYERQDQLRRTLPDILDTLTISVEAGLGFDAAMAQVTHHAKGPVAGELSRVMQEMQIGVPRVDALRALATRTRVMELRTFCSVVVQATELGLPIAGVLREQSKEMRIRRRQYAEELAQKVPVKILFPLVFCLLPSLFIVVIGPGILNIAEVFFQ